MRPKYLHQLVHLHVLQRRVDRHLAVSCCSVIMILYQTLRTTSLSVLQIHLKNQLNSLLSVALHCAELSQYSWEVWLKTKRSSEVVPIFMFSLLAPQSGAHRIASYRDPIQPIHPLPNPIPLIALKQERPMM